MKKIIFVINNLEIGGVQKSLLNLLCEIHNKYDITLMTFFGNEASEKIIPRDIKIIKPRSSFRQLGLSVKHTKNKPLLYLERAFYIILTKLFGRSFVINLMCFGKKKYKGYDIAISYIHESSQKNLYGGCNEFILKMVEAKKKIGWLHCDFERCGANNSQSKQIYGKLDQIVTCSEGCQRSFVKCLPEFADKTISIQNCNNYEQIRLLAREGVRYDNEIFNIVTVARLSEEKGIDRALDAIHQCVIKGHKVKYHIVGSGGSEHLLKNKVAALGLENHVVFYGNQQNPYPYIKNADLFLLTSYHEAAPMVFDEAACLGVPVFATETTSTHEMLTACGHGIVCKNEQSNITLSLLELLSSPEKLDKIKNKLSVTTFDNSQPVKKLAGIIE